MSVFLDGMESHKGCTLYLYESMGNSFAIVWDTDKVRKTLYGTTKCDLVPDSRTMVDVVPEVLSMAEKWLTEQILTNLEEKAKSEANEPNIGKRVRSTTKYGNHVGTEGIVKKRIVDRFRTRHFKGFNTGTHYRILVRMDNNELTWMSADNCEVVEPEYPNQYEMEEKAYELAKEHNWYGIFCM